MHAVRTSLFVTTIFGIALLIQAAGAAHDLADPLDVTGVALVSSEADGDYVTETYRATLHHSGAPDTRDFALVKATLTGAIGLSIPGFIQVVEGDVSFGTVRAGETIDSLDTFMIKRLHRIPLNPRQLRWQIAARPDFVLPDEWTGKWRFTITRTDPATQQLESTTTVTDTLGLREPIGFSLLPDFVRCRWHGDPNSLEAACSGSARVGWCVTSGSASFDLHRDIESASGQGTVQVSQEGDCPAANSVAADAIAIAGTRLTSEANDEPLSLGLLPVFPINPYFSALLSDGIRSATTNEPATDSDCAHGGWRRFRRPWFDNERMCTAFLHGESRWHQNGGPR